MSDESIWKGGLKSPARLYHDFCFFIKKIENVINFTTIFELK